MVKQEPYSPTIAIRLLNIGIKKEREAMARKRKSAAQKYEAYRRRILKRKPSPRKSPPKRGLEAVVANLTRSGVMDRAVNQALAGWVPPKRKVRAPKKRKSNRAATRYTPMYDVFNTMSKQPIAFKHVYIRPRSTLNSVVRSIPQSKTPIYRLF